MSVLKETPTRARDSKTRTFLKRLLKPLKGFRRFAGTPLLRARAIMGLNMHDVGAVRLHLGHDDAFSKAEYLQRVPYTERELEWAVKNGLVLTIVSASMRRIARVAGREVQITKEIAAMPHIAGRSPRHPQWCLVSRLPQEKVETRSLGLSEKEKKRRLQLAPAAVALTTLYLDCAIYGIVPKGLYLTANPFGEDEGDFTRRILVGGSIRADSLAFINVVTGRSEATHAPVMMLKPHKILLP